MRSSLTRRSQKLEYSTHVQALENLESGVDVHRVIENKQKKYRQDLEQQIKEKREREIRKRQSLKHVEDAKMKEMMMHFPYGRIGGNASLHDPNTNPLVTSIQGLTSEMAKPRGTSETTSIRDRSLQYDPRRHNHGKQNATTPRIESAKLYPALQAENAYSNLMDGSISKVTSPARIHAHTRYNPANYFVEDQEMRNAKKLKQIETARLLQEQLNLKQERIKREKRESIEREQRENEKIRRDRAEMAASYQREMARKGAAAPTSGLQVPPTIHSKEASIVSPVSTRPEHELRGVVSVGDGKPSTVIEPAFLQTHPHFDEIQRLKTELRSQRINYEKQLKEKSKLVEVLRSEIAKFREEQISPRDAAIKQTSSFMPFSLEHEDPYANEAIYPEQWQEALNEFVNHEGKWSATTS